MYSDKVMEHFANPHNMGELKDANAIGEVGNAQCGDIMRMYLKIEDDVIKDASFKTFGCCAAIASSSVSTDMLKGKTIDEALKIKNSDVVRELDGLPPVKIHCSVLAEEAIQKAIENYRSEQQDKQGSQEPVVSNK
jgi:nitrogen fixation NifU-like protein